MDDLKKKTLNGLIWKFSERICAQLVTFIVSIILARILLPEDYGAIALVMVFISIADVFVSSGFGSALIQKKDADQVDFSSVFYFNLGFSIIVYIILFIIAPFISSFYNMQVLSSVLRVLGLKIPLAAINSVQSAYISRHMLFKKFFLATLGGTIGSAVVGIIFAYNGYGVWALVAQYLFNSVVDTIILWFTVKWRPKKIFNFKRLKPLLNFGWKLLASKLVNEVISQLRNLIIGKVYTSSDLAYYNKGVSFPNLILTNINASITAVVYPAMSKLQDNSDRFKKYLLKSISYSTFIIAPIMMGMFIVSDNIIELLLTDKWMFCVPYVQIACLYSVFQPLTTMNLEAINAIGRSDLDLKFAIIKRGLAIILIILTVKYGVFVMALTDIIVTIVAVILNSTVNKKLFNITLLEYINSFMPHILRSTVMSIGIWIITRSILINYTKSLLITLILQVFIGIFIYILLCAFTRCKEFNEIIVKIKNIKNI